MRACVLASTSTSMEGPHTRGETRSTASAHSLVRGAVEGCFLRWCRLTGWIGASKGGREEGSFEGLRCEGLVDSCRSGEGKSRRMESCAGSLQHPRGLAVLGRVGSGGG